MNNHTNLEIVETVKIGDIEIYGGTIPYNGHGGDIIKILKFNELYDLDKLLFNEKKKINSFNQKLYQSNYENLKNEVLIKEMMDRYVNRLNNIELNNQRIGILIGDVMGHDPADQYYARDFVKWFEIAADFDIERYGEITKRTMEKVNNMLFKEFQNIEGFVAGSKYITSIYGEISSNGTFRFISAGHNQPIIYSKEFNKIIDLPKNIVNSGFPLGIRLSNTSFRKIDSFLGYEDEYVINTMKLESPGDIFILYTDGLIEQKNKNEDHYHSQKHSKLEEKLKEVSYMNAKDIYYNIKKDLFEFSENNKLEDDVSYVIIKKLLTN